MILILESILIWLLCGILGVYLAGRLERKIKSNIISPDSTNSSDVIFILVFGPITLILVIVFHFMVLISFNRTMSTISGYIRYVFNFIYNVPFNIYKFGRGDFK